MERGTGSSISACGSVLPKIKRPNCPGCGGDDVVRNGRTRHGRQNYRCKSCGRQFVAGPLGRIPAIVAEIVDRMIEDHLSMSKIVEYTGVSAAWIYNRRKEKSDG